MKFRTTILLIVATTGILSTLAAVWVSSQRISDQGTKSLVEKSQAILSRLEAVRGYVASQGGLKSAVAGVLKDHPDGNVPKEVKLDILKQVPIFASMKVGNENADKEHYTFRVFSDKPRNKDNQATASELEIFKRFEVDPNLPEITESTDDEVRVYRPVRLAEAQGCLVCHGEPSTSPWKNGKDILGVPMEDWKDGYLHGVFAITSSKAEVKAAAWRSTMNMAMWGGLISLLILGGAVVVLRKPLKNLDQISDSLRNAGEQINSASREISGSSQNLSQSASQAAAHIEQTSASTEEMNSMISRNLENIGQARNLADTAKVKAEGGQKTVSDLIVSMEDIKQSSKRISDIITVIDDIAFQTNLLALNAAVEAARAGEQGKGFAVVAEAVRALAQRSASSAKEISQLINESATKVDEGSDKVHQSGKSLEEIVKAVNDLAVLNTEISQASTEQSQGLKQITQSIQEMDGITQKTAGVAEESAAASEELSAQAEQMKGMVHQLTSVLNGK